MKTLIYRSDDMTLPANLLRAGGLVAFPTETVYGIACDGTNAEAVRTLYQVKNRSFDKPLSLLVSGVNDIEALCRDVPESALILADSFWPGPLTIILKKKPLVPPIVTSGGDTVGLRCPDHAKALSLLRVSGVPLTAPSANIAGFPEATDVLGVLAYFEDKIDCVIDGGLCAVGIASTVIDMTGIKPRILRQGGLARGNIEKVLRCEVEHK